jgi:hypothetical protein
MDETIDDLAEWYERAVDERCWHDHRNLVAGRREAGFAIQTARILWRISRKRRPVRRNR